MAEVGGCVDWCGSLFGDRYVATNVIGGKVEALICLTRMRVDLISIIIMGIILPLLTNEGCPDRHVGISSHEQMSEYELRGKKED